MFSAFRFQRPRPTAPAPSPAPRAGRVLCGVLILAVSASSAITRESAADPARVWGDWIEQDFPFFSATVDARAAGGRSPANNLTPRGLVLNLGYDQWACFDTELLRVAAVWRGDGVLPRSLSMISYHEVERKSLDGQTELPEPVGHVWLANGVYPGWQVARSVSLTDPREPAPSPEEVGRGPLPASQGRFGAVRLTMAGAVLEYDVGAVRIEELVTAIAPEQGGGIRRIFRVGPSPTPFLLVAGLKPVDSASVDVSLGANDAAAGVEIIPHASAWIVRLPARTVPGEFSVTIVPEGSARLSPFEGFPPEAEEPAPTPWGRELTTRGTLSADSGAYVVDEIPLPINNPWQRNVRLADVQFFRTGQAAGVTFDGDVWIIDGLKDDLSEVVWRRFASGLHEPMSLVIRDEEIFVYDRNGIWLLVDTDGDGAADRHELFSNAFAQTAETREFPSSMKLAPDGSLVIAKGGQESTLMGKHNGTVIRVAPDGRSITVLGTGLRQPFIGVHPMTGRVTASDQEGHYVPATPIHVIRDGRFYGHLSRQEPVEQYPAPITEPVLWIPHLVNPSAVTQVWLTGARMGPLNGALINLGYNRPELFRVMLDERGPIQGAVVSLTRNLDFAPLNGAVNPLDGQLYVAGFRVWGTTAGRVSGLARIRYTGAPSRLPREVVATDQGILLCFDVALGADAADRSRYVVERWNYRRTSAYGSPHYKLDGSLGQDRLAVSDVHLSRDRKSVFIGVPDMRAGVMQMHVGWSLPAAGGMRIDANAYLTAHQLSVFDPVAAGFGGITIDLTPPPDPPPGQAEAEAVVSVAEGRRLYEFIGCMACHSTDGSARFGPGFRGLAGRERPLADGTKVRADRAYLRESILHPDARVAKGFENGMPPYLGVLNDAQLESLILFIESLSAERTRSP